MLKRSFQSKANDDTFTYSDTFKKLVQLIWNKNKFSNITTIKRNKQSVL